MVAGIILCVALAMYTGAVMMYEDVELEHEHMGK